MLMEDDYKATRSAVVSFFILVFFGVIVSRLFYIQVVMGPSYIAIAEAQQSKYVSVSGERGVIFDRNGKVLARNIENISLFIDPTTIVGKKNSAKKIAKATGISYNKIMKKIQKKGRYVAVSRNIGWDKEEQIKKMAKELNSISAKKYKVNSIFYDLKSRRFYPNEGFLSHTLGFALQENKGLAGIERVYDKYLTASSVSMVYEKDARGRRLFPKGWEEYEGRDSGSNLVLTIDEVIQHFAERELDAVMASSKAKSATAIVMNPANGEILAMAVRPNFDPNNAGKFKPSSRRNRIITDVYEPGSTFKTIVASALIEENVVGMDELIDLENGSIKIGRRRIRDSHKVKGSFGFQDIFKMSSNVGMVKLTGRLGDDKFFSFIKRFGFGEKTGIDLIGEVNGILHKPSRWSATTKPNMAMGQGIAVTPLQLATAFSTVVNGGDYIKPHVVREVIDENGRLVKRFEPKLVRKVLSKRTSNIMKDFLVAVVEDGTGKNTAIEGYHVGGKTGTAQKVDPKTKRYSHKLMVSSFIGFAPLENPQFVVLVTVDEPQGVYWGGAVAGPVFKNILERSLRYMAVPEDKDKPEELPLLVATK